MRSRARAALAVWIFLGACTSRVAMSDAGAGDDAYIVGDAGPHIVLGTTARPATVIIPPGADGTTRLPLVVVLAGYGVGGAFEDRYLHISQAAAMHSAYVVLPNGTNDSMGRLAWNDGIEIMTNADDVAYLTSLLDQAEAMLPIDTHRVYFVGHENGGFMAYRMACQAAARVTGIFALAAGDYPNDTDCTPARAVSVLHAHGTLDMATPYDGNQPQYAGAVETTQRWATRASCNLAMAQTPAAFDFDSAVPGNETTATDYAAGCVNGVRVSLYTMTGSGHTPGITLASAGMVLDWLFARSL
jgi:polyhydroxybutyrate depolymerase